ncbi:MAG TPA: hypothetical protein VLI92_01850 [Candidatus Saccharimonadales bacterium]|nr:hypothetical protein [Candidatus Saccharimonadales bacterium]
MQKGSSGLLVIIFIALLVILPVSTWVVIKSTAKDGSVQGASTVDSSSTSPGFSVNVVAKSSGWDLEEYVCKTLDECSNSPESGMRWATISGGQTALHKVDVLYTSELDSYSYMKVLVKSGWGTSLKTFKISEAGSVPGSKKQTLKDGQVNYDVLLLPLDKVKTAFYTSATFSDNL